MNGWTYGLHRTKAIVQELIRDDPGATVDGMGMIGIHTGLVVHLKVRRERHPS